jgi:hypothetical protein
VNSEIKEITVESSEMLAVPEWGAHCIRKFWAILYHLLTILSTAYSRQRLEPRISHVCEMNYSGILLLSIKSKVLNSATKNVTVIFRAIKEMTKFSFTCLVFSGVSYQ